jgi:catechol 2,3-dioxygenase-like lactoylglutathione lyase family enzyme
MSKTKTPRGIKATPAKSEAPDDVPQFFRVNVEVGDLDEAISFYTDLLGLQGRKQAGRRCYFDCGPVTLQVLDVSSNGQPHAAAKSLYFTVENLEAVFDRAKALSCLSREDVHDAPAGGKHETEARSIITRRLAEELDTYCRANGLDRPMLRFSDAGSDAAAGVLLQYYKQSHPIAVPDEWLFLVGDPFKSNGRETSEFYLMKEEEGALPDGVTNHVWLATYGSHRLIRLFRATPGPQRQ